MTTPQQTREIKGLTLPRPLGYAIAYLDKRIESFRYECPLKPGDFLAIHNSEEWDESAADYIRSLNESKFIDDPTKENDLPNQIIAVVQFVENVTDDDSEWFIPGCVGWRLGEVVSIEPVPCLSKPLGLWSLGRGTLRDVREAYAEALKELQREGW